MTRVHIGRRATDCRPRRAKPPLLTGSGLKRGKRPQALLQCQRPQQEPRGLAAAVQGRLDRPRHVEIVEQRRGNGVDRGIIGAGAARCPVEQLEALGGPIEVALVVLPGVVPEPVGTAISAGARERRSTASPQSVPAMARRLAAGGGRPSVQARCEVAACCTRQHYPVRDIEPDKRSRGPRQNRQPVPASCPAAVRVCEGCGGWPQPEKVAVSWAEATLVRCP